MDQEWTTGIESLLLNREKVAEGKGFEPLDRVNGRRFSRPVLSTTQPPLHRSDELQAYPDAESLCREAHIVNRRWACIHFNTTI